MSKRTIERSKKAARKTNELVDHLIALIESHDERFSFEWSVGGEFATMEIYDKENKIAYKVKIEPMTSDIVDGVATCCGSDMDKAKFCPICGKKLIREE